MKKLIILSITLLFVSPVIAFDYYPPFYDTRYGTNTHNTDMGQTLRQQRRTWQNMQKRKQEQEREDEIRDLQRQTQEIIDNQRKMIQLQRQMKREQEHQWRWDR